VSYDSVEVFISLLNKKTGENYRLPTEAEWEYCARGGQKNKIDYKYSGSNNLPQVAVYGMDKISGNPKPVGDRLPNALIIHDMNGNVSEWCSDWYKLDYYRQRVRVNPKGPKDNQLKSKVVRGGSWKDKAGSISVTARTAMRPNEFDNSVGFRLVLIKK
jgi:formylglycine-generating enzyme required for sulfatase activity